MSNIKYFRTWQGLANFLHQTDKFAQLQDKFYAQEQFPLSEREIKIQDNGKEIILKIFYDIDTMNISNPPAPYPSWTWNDSTKQWDPPKPRPTNPVTEYDLLWNEVTQGWGLANVSRHKIKTIIFRTWKELKQYLADNDQLINTYNQLQTQEQLATAEEREIICPEGAHFVSLRCQG